MSALSSLDPYSARFAEALFAKFPVWRSAARAEGAMSGAPGALVVEVSAPSGYQLWVTTDGGEVTIGFAEWHGHFGPWVGSGEQTTFGQALQCLDEICRDQLVIVATIVDGEYRGGATRHVGSEGLHLQPDEQVRFWSGSPPPVFLA